MHFTDRFIFFEAWVLIHVAKLFIKLFPLKILVKILGKQNFESCYIDSNLLTIKKIRSSLLCASSCTFHNSKCYDQAIAATIMLTFRKINSTFYFGLKKTACGNLEAHAWVRSGNIFICGGDNVEQYSIVGIFGNNF